MAEALQRLFVAVPVPPETRDAVRVLLEPVRALPFARDVRWVHLDTLHLTVRFLGDTQPAQVDAVRASVRAAVSDAQAFDVRLSAAGSFPPGGRKIRALWLGITEGADALSALADAVTTALVPLGWPPESRPYRPHLTVARTDSTGIRDAALASQALEGAAEAWEARFRAERVILYRSHLGGGPARHEVLEEVLLHGAG